MCLIFSSLSSIFQSTPPARGATAGKHLSVKTARISIHAPREGGDLWFSSLAAASSVISIHAPREGGDSSYPFASISL